MDARQTLDVDDIFKFADALLELSTAAINNFRRLAQLRLDGKLHTWPADDLRSALAMTDRQLRDIDTLNRAFAEAKEIRARLAATGYGHSN